MALLSMTTTLNRGDTVYRSIVSVLYRHCLYVLRYGDKNGDCVPTKTIPTMTIMRPLSWLFVFFLPAANPLSSPSVTESTSSTSSIADKLPPLTRTILPIPASQCSSEISYVQKATNGRISGLRELQEACASWEESFQSELGVNSAIIGKIASVSPQTKLVRWNVTWVPPTAAWLEFVGNVWPGVEVTPTSYNHLSGKASTFSWTAVFRIFSDALTTGKLRIPLACIEGTSELRFDTKSGMLIAIAEELAYAQDLRRGVLLNRRCSADLRVFLETGRRMNVARSTQNNDEWDDIVATALPWSSVPGSNPLDVDPVEEGDGPAIVFLGIVALVLLGFANIIGPQLIGQSLFGPPNYIVPPEELNSLF